MFFLSCLGGKSQNTKQKDYNNVAAAIALTICLKLNYPACNVYIAKSEPYLSKFQLAASTFRFSLRLKFLLDITFSNLHGNFGNLDRI